MKKIQVQNMRKGGFNRAYLSVVAENQVMRKLKLHNGVRERERERERESMKASFDSDGKEVVLKNGKGSVSKTLGR